MFLARNDSFSNKLCEGCHESNLFRSTVASEVIGYPGEVVSEESGPSTEKTVPFALSCCHDAIVDVCVCSTEEILDKVMLLNWNNVQECLCGGVYFCVKNCNKVYGLVECSLEAQSAKVL